MSTGWRVFIRVAIISKYFHAVHVHPKPIRGSPAQWVTDPPGKKQLLVRENYSHILLLFIEV